MSAITEPCQAGMKPELWLVLSRRTLRLPQSASASSRFGLGAETDCPSTIRLVIPESERSADVPDAVTAARNDDTVISPPKSETSVSSVRAYAVPSSGFAEELTSVDPAETIEPSAG
jgi:hypothetical protein